MASIKIIQNQDDTIAFLPPGPNPKPNQPAGVNENDTVTWNNQTERPRVVVVKGKDPETEFTTDPIQPGMPSSPTFIAQKNKAMEYSCACVDPAVPEYKIVVVTPKKTAFASTTNSTP